MPKVPRPAPGSSPLTGPGLSRRAFVELSASGLLASFFLPSWAEGAEVEATGVTPRGTARNAILVFLPGAPSHIDTFDLKEGAFTPADFKPTTYGAIRWPQGLMPKLAERLADVAIVRSMMSWALVHSLAQTWVQIARNPTGATGGIAPHLGAITALELASKRDPKTDVLPGFVALNTGSLTGAGYLPSTTSPFLVTPSANGLASLSHPDGASRFALRWKDLGVVDGSLRTGAPLGKEAADVAGFYDQAKVLMDSAQTSDASNVNNLFKYTTDESQRYGNTSFGNSCLVARKLLAGRRGVRFVQVTLGGWDSHSGIYAATGGLPTAARTNLDPALAALLDDLKATPGEAAGRTLLDETLVVVAGEFGRTVGALNGQAGRDHYFVHSVLLAGGGVRGGQVVGATDSTGAKVVQSGMPGRTELRTEDIACTVYSALGIDWTTVRHDDPLNRGFEYVPYAKDGAYGPIEALFG